MKLPRYRLRTLLALVTVVAVCLGCWFGGIGRIVFIALSLEPGGWQVQSETVFSGPGKSEQRVTCYTIDPASFEIAFEDETGEKRSVQLEGNGTGLIGLRWLQLRVAIRDGELQVREEPSNAVVVRHRVGGSDWPKRDLGRRTSGGWASRGVAKIENLAPGVWLVIQHDD